MITVRCIFLLALLSVLFCDPVPDTSDKCLTCEAKVTQLEAIWMNSSSVEEILANLDEKCEMMFPNDTTEIKQQFCKDIANVFVQIPPSLFEGMESLAWPIPEALCATFYQCYVDCCGESDPPEQIHLSLASSDMSVMGVTWVTLRDKFSVVQYGLHSKALSSISTGSISTYLAAGWRGTIHRALMSNLKPNTKYYYRVGDGFDRWSEVYSFTTLADNQTITYAIIADMDYDSNTTMENIHTLVENNVVQVVIHSGDISYADGYEPHWDVFFRRIEPIAAQVPYMVTPGNHEFWYNFTSYKHRFFMPGELDLTGSGSGDGMYYSWNSGFTHFVAANSETPIDTANFNDAMIEWMEQDLQSVDRSFYPFIIVHFHRPMYCSNNDACTTKGGDRLRSQAEELFYKYQVNLVLTGHVHSYERTYPVWNNTLQQTDYQSPKAPVYVLQGGSGNREGNDGFPTDNVPDWSAGHDSSVGYGLMRVSSNQIDFEYYESVDEANGGAVLKDSFSMTL